MTIYGQGPYADALRAHIGDAYTHAWIAEHTQTDVDGKPLRNGFDFAVDVCADLAWGTLTILSTQLPVGSCKTLEAMFPGLLFAVQPENVRAASAVADFEQQTRFVVGCRHQHLQPLFANLFDGRVVWMSPESAEMTKHAMNVYLALCIRYGNELGRLCELWDADVLDVVSALRSEPRVSSTAPLLPGDPPSEHLMREVHTMIGLGAGPLIRSLR